MFRLHAAARVGSQSMGQMMNEVKAHRVLDVQLGVTMATIRAAYRDAVKRYHPDRNGDPDARNALQRAHEAYRVLRDRPPSQLASLNPRPCDERAGDTGPGAADDEAKGPDAVSLVRSVMANRELFFRFDGSIQVGSGPRRVYGPGEAEAWRERPDDWTVARLLDATTDEVRGHGLDHRGADVARALRRIVREDRQARETTVMMPLLFDPLEAAERARAEAMWLRLVGTILDMDPELGVGVLQHFVWQVKRKQLYLPVCHHLMPVLVSPVQGSGKTTFLRRFLGPLQELASDPVLLSDLADRRSGEILGFPVVFVDDVERLDPRLNATLKSLLTADAVSRRRLGSSSADKRRQRATLIGTANEPIATLICDPTGHRRFAELPFRNGAVAKGGDVAVWRAVEEADYDLLWRSVDGFGPSPILHHLAALVAAQAAAAPPDRLRECLVRLDLRSADVQNISMRGGVRADDLRLLLCALLGEEITANRFCARMAELVGDPLVPFKPKIRLSQGYIYPLKKSAHAAGGSAPA